MDADQGWRAAMSALADIRRGWELPGDSLAVQYSPHSLKRYRDRIRPALELDAVRRELCHLLATATVTRERPAWLHDDERQTAAYLLLAGGTICLPLVDRGGELIATTALMEGMIEGTRRENRNRANATARSGKQGARRANRMETGKPVSGPDVSEWER